MDHQKITHYLEVICQSGCDTVNATIEAMEKDQSISAVKDLDSDEKKVVLRELKAIMAVYDPSAK